MNNNIDYHKLMNQDVAYPSLSDSDFQYKMYKKREFYYNKIPYREKLKTDEDIKNYRDKICGGERATFPHQAFLANYMNPDSPFKNLLIFHGVGTGKTCAAIKIAEQFKELVTKYDTKIYVLVSGPIIKENWKNELLLCTGDTYLKQSSNMDSNQKKNAINAAQQYYRFISYRSFYRKVLGEKIVEKVKEGNKIKTTYRKNNEGTVERDEVIDKIYNLNNSLLIVDEAHHLINNDYGNAVKQIIDNSENLKVVLLTATPMPNMADDIISLINFILPKNEQLQRDKIFSSDKNYNMKIKPDGLKYLLKKTSGYVSYLRGADPITFAERIDKGIVPEGLIFTKVIKCQMLDFQLQTYLKAVTEDDALDKKTEAVANFVFPGLNSDKTELSGFYGRQGINIVKNNIETNAELLNDLINKKFFNGKQDDINLINLSSNKKFITGDIFKYKNLKYFSIKFYAALQKLQKLVHGQKGLGTAFVYSNLVKVGIELFQEILLQNGYLEFTESGLYQIKSYHICYYCGLTYSVHDINNVLDHDFAPATFLTVTGKTEDSIDILQEEKQQLIVKYFNNIKNKDGKIIKFVLGSKVMNEGITLKNVREIHILDVHYNLNSIDQVMGRAIRHCVHYDITNENNKNPKVNVYKYVVSIENELSSEEKMYKKAELKYLLVKQIERVLKEGSIDCPLNRPGNIFPEELEKYKDCKMGTDKPCPAICDYMDCNYICANKKLNDKYYNKQENKYNDVIKEDIDYTTFNKNLANSEIEYAIIKIKEMFKLNVVYTLKHIVDYIYNSYSPDKQLLFDSFFVYIALERLLPITENEFNNFTDVIYNKYNEIGYLIHVNKYYIFQPFAENTNVPIQYRTNVNIDTTNKVSVQTYVKNANINIDKLHNDFITYEYDDSYYDTRKECKIIGIIDKITSTRNTSQNLEQQIFKIKDNLSNVSTSKRRGMGITSNMGAVGTTFNKSTLHKYMKLLHLPITSTMTKEDLCNKIKDKLLELEKYTDHEELLKENDKYVPITYMKIPINHPIYKFPYNLGDRKHYIMNKITSHIKFNIVHTIKKNIDKKTKHPSYVITLVNSVKLKEFYNMFIELGGILKNDNWIFTIE